ncbi:class I SAM-dependent methyltransferase [Nocardia macrotermitis]|uniref:S-adenosyl-L-methionine-dependent methyltransferase n=1 Tax=Nocardia macrotermitis TaxID=2585198 RepID=A0A7K0D8H7_9NOCA|nr:class I SAM-dependent methyltransferase [Nocardia macrotermitis]MQY22018.1 hypothetical protein [Nocardia macrotermitis]
MQHDGPSGTALVTAYARAYHQLADRPIILTDPLALPLLGITEAELIEKVDPASGHIVSAVSDKSRRQFFATRTRFAEDRVAAAYTTGTRQVVILGAGLDTFAYRNPHPDLHVYEVDHPATQAWKRERLTAAGIDHPGTLTFVPVDFETQTLATQLESAGFDRTAPAVFVWLGVVYYLTPEAARATLQYTATQAPPTEVVFDYLQPAGTDEEKAHLRARAASLAAAGEPWLTSFTPEEIATHLHTLGLTDIDDRPAITAVASYLDNATDIESESPRPLRAIRLLRAAHPSRDI